jgi:hypothetical protein
MTPGQYDAFLDAKAEKSRKRYHTLKKEKRFIKRVEKNRIRDIIKQPLTMG